MKNLLIHFLVLLCGGLALAAEKADDSAARQPRGRLAWFVYTSLPKDIENPVDVMTDSKITRVMLSARAASAPVRIPADGVIRIVRKVDDPKNPAKFTYLTLAQAAVADGVAEALIILIPITNPQDSRVFHARVQDLASFKGGDSLYLNLTNLNIGVELGKTSIPIKPGETKIHNAPPLDKPTDIPIRYSFYQPVQKKWQTISASTIVQQATRREICIFSWDPRFERVDYRGITFPVTQ